MDNSRLGCLTRSGIIFAVLTIITLAAVMIFNGNVLFNPGPLNAQAGNPLGGATSHAEIGGHCNACHAPFWSGPGMANLCMNCHADIVTQQLDPQSLHGSLLQGGISGSCWSCHPDHRGTNASLTLVNAINFPHDKLGFPVPFPLTGAHKAVACTQCHVNNVFKGTPTDCASCHPEPASHAGQFGVACAQCHTTSNWNATFNHPNACGRVDCLNHRRATCADCHPVNYTTATCTKCHRNNNPGGGG